MSVKRGGTKIWRYWNTDQLPELRLSSAEEYLECFRERFDRSVLARLRTRGAVGAQFLAAFKKLVEDPLTMLL